MGGHTDVYFIALEIIPVEGVLVELDDGPVDGEPVGPVGGGADRVSVQHITDDPLIGGEHGLGDAAVEVD